MVCFSAGTQKIASYKHGRADITGAQTTCTVHEGLQLKTMICPASDRDNASRFVVRQPSVGDNQPANQVADAASHGPGGSHSGGASSVDADHRALESIGGSSDGRKQGSPAADRCVPLRLESTIAAARTVDAGFQSANGRPVLVSAEARIKAEELIASTEKDDDVGMSRWLAAEGQDHGFSSDVDASLATYGIDEVTLSSKSNRIRLDLKLCSSVTNQNHGPETKPKGFRPFKKPRRVERPASPTAIRASRRSASDLPPDLDDSEGKVSDLTCTQWTEVSEITAVFLQNERQFSEQLFTQQRSNEKESSEPLHALPRTDELETRTAAVDDGVMRTSEEACPTSRNDIETPCGERKWERDSAPQTNLGSRAQLSVGDFQTVRGNAMPVSEKALQKAAQILDESLNGNVELTDAVPSVEGQFPLSNQVAVGPKSAAEEATENLDSSVNEAVDAEAIAAIRKMTKVTELADVDIQGENDIPSEKTAETVIVPRSPTTLSAEARRDDSDGLADWFIPEDIQPAETTTGDKVSEKSPATAANIHTDDDISDGKTFFGLTTAKGGKVEVSEKSLATVRNIISDERTNDDICDGKSFLGFTTAKGRKVKVSEKSLAAVRNIISDEKTNDDICDGKSFMGFTTAKGRKVEVSEKSLAAVRNIISDEKTNDDICDGKSFMGFTTAKGRKVEVSEKSLAAVRNIISDEKTNDDICDGKSFMGFTTAKGRKVEVSEKSLAAVRNIISDEKTNDDICDGKSFMGFTTAKGRKVEVSEKSLAAVRNIISDEKTNDDIYDGKSFMGFTTAKGRKVEVSEKSLAAVRNIISDEKTNDDICDGKSFMGFTTAKGRKVEVSEKSLAAVRNIISDEKTNDDICDGKSFMGFTTAKGRKVEVSEKSLAAVRNIISDEKTNDDICDGKSFMGFTTAKGRKVEVSEKSLAAVRNIISDEKTNDDICDGKSFMGFTTAKGRKVEVSEKSLAAVRNIISDEKTNDDICDGKSFMGFTTAKGRKVEVSEKSLAAVRNIISDEKTNDDICDGKSFMGFTTAKGRKVEVSEKSLAAVRNIISDEKTNDDICDGKSFLGFTTAKGRKVEVSENSLAAVRHISEGQTEKVLTRGSSLSGATPASNSVDTPDASPALKTLASDAAGGMFHAAKGTEVTVCEAAPASVRCRFSLSSSVKDAGGFPAQSLSQTDRVHGRSATVTVAVTAAVTAGVATTVTPPGTTPVTVASAVTLAVTPVGLRSRHADDLREASESMKALLADGEFSELSPAANRWQQRCSTPACPQATLARKRTFKFGKSSMLYMAIKIITMMIIISYLFQTHCVHGPY